MNSLTCLYLQIKYNSEQILIEIDFMKKIFIIVLFFVSSKAFAQPVIDTINTFPDKTTFFVSATVPLGLNISSGIEIRLFKSKKITLIPTANLIAVSGFYNRTIPDNRDQLLLAAFVTVEARYYFLHQRQIIVNDTKYKNRKAYYASVKQFWIADPIIKGNQENLNYDRGAATAFLLGTQESNKNFFWGAFAGFVFYAKNAINNSNVYIGTEIPRLQLGVTIGYRF